MAVRAELARSVAELASCTANMTQILANTTVLANHTFRVEVGLYSGASAAGAIEICRLVWLKARADSPFPLDRYLCNCNVLLIVLFLVKGSFQLIQELCLHHPIYHSLRFCSEMSISLFMLDIVKREKCTKILFKILRKTSLK